MPSIVRRLSQRSTKTPAIGPTTSTAVPPATRTPLTAAGAQLSSFASTVATHSIRVVLKTMSPMDETACPNQSRVKSGLMRVSRGAMTASPR